MKKRLVSLLLIVVMLVGMMPAIGITAGAATADPMKEGMTFTAENEYIVPYKLDVGAGMTRQEQLTIEAEVYIPDTKRAGVVVGTYSGTSQHDISLEIESNGRVRIYTSKMGQILFDDDGKRKDPATGAQTTANTKYNIRDYMTDGKFVKIAVVINAADQTGTLYLNGAKQVTYPFCADKGTVQGKWGSGYLTTVNEFRLGGDHRADNAQYFKGSVKNVALYSDARTESEVCTGINASDPNLLFGFDLTDPLNPLSDLSMNKRHIVEPQGADEIVGMKFNAERLNEIPYKFNVTKPENGDEAITLEATLHIPQSTSDGTRAGIIVGNYTDAPTMKDCLNVELHQDGKVRVYMPKADDIKFPVDIRDYVGSDISPKFVKIAVVINVTAKSTSLYVNGSLASTVSMPKLDPGDLVLSESLCVGGDLRSGNKTYFKGTLKDLAIYTDVRTAAEIKASAESFAPDASDASLVCAYDFSKNDASSYNDLSGENRHLVFKPQEKSRTFTLDWKDAVSKPFPNAPKTMEATVYLPANVTARGGTIFGNLDNSLGNNTYHNFEIYSNGVPRFYYNTSKDTVTFKDVDVRSYNGWVHIAYVFDDSGDTNVLYLYINGKLVASADKDDNGKALVDYNAKMNNTTYCVGMDFRAESNKPENARFKGYIKDVAVYTDARSAAEIASDYANGAAVDDEDIIAAYNFSTGSYFKDMTGNGYDLVTPEDLGMDFDQYEVYRTEGSFTKAPYSFETWLNLPSSYDGSKRGGTIFGSYNRVGGDAGSNSLNIEIDKNGNPRICYYGTKGKWRTFVFKEVDVRSDNWVHLAIVADIAGGKIECYLNGELAQTMTVDSNGSAIIAYNSTIPTVFCLGGDMRDTDIRSKYNSEYFKGTVLDFAAYSDVRTAEEIKASYRKGVDLTDTGLISYYDLSEVEDGAEIIYDAKKNNNVATTWQIFPVNDTSDYAYTFVMIGDTQKLVEQDYMTGTSYMQQIYQWIADNKDKHNIKFVMGLGDITEDGHRKNDKGWAEWEIAKTYIPLLGAAGIPYSLVPGNHENPTQLTTYFGDEASLVDNITGYYKTKEEAPDTWLGNYYIDFEVMGVKYTVFVFEYGAKDDILNWASEIIQSKPDRRIILTTHCYLYRDGTTLDNGDVCPPEKHYGVDANNGDEMWDKLVSQHANIFMVLSGHDPCENIVYRQDLGVNGNLVTQFLIDPQGMDPKYDYQTGMVALFHFSADGRQLAVEYVSTVRNEYFKSVNQFELELFVPCEHAYDNDCDADCNLCGEERAVEGHKYDNDFDADCNICGEEREVPKTEGALNTKITWKYENGVLTVVGKGKIKNFSAGKADWSALADYVDTVVIGEGITYIGASAFYGFTKLDTVNLPTTLTAIGNYAFYGCSALNSISIPENVTEIGSFAFRRSALTDVTFAIGYGWSAGDNAFALDEIVTGGATYLATGFYKSVWTRDVNAEVEVMDPNFVDGGICGNNIKWTVTRLENGKLKLTVSGEGAMPSFGTAKTPWFGYASDIVEIEVTEGVTTIGRCAFYGLKFVRKATIADTVTAIDDYGFYMCFLLKSIDLPDGVTVSENAFVKTGVSI